MLHSQVMARFASWNAIVAFSEQQSKTCPWIRSVAILVSSALER